MVAPRGELVLVSDTPPPLSRRDRAYLSNAAAEIRSRLTTAGRDMLIAGKKLHQVSRRIGRGHVVEWLRSGAAGVKPATAYRLMAVYRAFGTAPPEAMKNIARVSLYALAQPDVPQSLREFIIEQAADGKHYGEAETLRLIEEQRKPVVPMKGYKSPTAQPRPAVDPQAVHAADNWLALLVVLQKPGCSLHVSASADPENGDRAVSVTMLADGQKPKTVVRNTLEDAVVELGGLKRMKVCRSCLEPKRFDEFSRLKDSHDGRNRACLACERERVAEPMRAKTAVFLVDKPNMAAGGQR